MSRNARCYWILPGLVFALLAGSISLQAQVNSPLWSTNSAARMVIIEGNHLLDAFIPDEDRVEGAFNRGLTLLTARTNAASAWLSLVTTSDIVGIKVCSAPGPVSGTRPAVVSAIVHGLTEAGLPASHVIIWDRHLEDLRAAGFTELGRRLGTRVEGAVNEGYDTNTFYLPDSPVTGQLVWGDLEFGRTNKDFSLGKKSYVSKLVSQQMTKIISVAPLMNDSFAGINGHFYSLALGSVDNTRRFESNPDRLAVALPEIYALPSIGDRVVLLVTDALLLQYEGGPQSYLQFSQVRNQLWFSHDPVALDVVGMRELSKQRELAEAPPLPANYAIYTNAVLLQLGISDPRRIGIEKALEVSP